MKVLVTGGSGFVGREIVRQLRAAGHTPRVLSRGVQTPEHRVEWVHGSVLEPGGLRAACMGCDVVIHLVGIISEYGEQTYERVHTEGTRNLLTAAREAGVPRWIQMSALGSRPGAVARYHRSKWEAEVSVRASGLDWTVFRPSVIYGPGDGFVNLFAAMTRWLPVVPLMGGGGTELQPIAVADVARAFVGAVSGTGVGREYDLCGPERVTLRALLEKILAATGRRRWLIGLPWWAARTQAAILEWLYPQLLRRAPPLNRDQLTMLAEGSRGDPGPACRDFGLNLEPLDAGLRAMLSESGSGLSRNDPAAPEGKSHAKPRSREAGN
jgi:uncharacterized protein YbjT (DUF2867 family)